MTTLMNTKTSSSNTGCKGVYRRRGKYESHITVKGKNTVWYKIHIGTYATLTEAVTARLNYIQSLA